MNGLGEPKNFLGILIKSDRENKVMNIQHKDYLMKKLERFKMEDSKIQSTPIVRRQIAKRKNRKGEGGKT